MKLMRIVEIPIRCTIVIREIRETFLTEKRNSSKFFYIILNLAILIEHQMVIVKIIFCTMSRK